MNMEKMKEAFSDKAFVKSLFELETAAEVQAALKEKDVELSEEEILGIRELLVKLENGEISAEQMESGELSDELLEQVSGGILLTAGAIAGILYWVGVGAGIGTGVGVAAAGVINAIEKRW